MGLSKLSKLDIKSKRKTIDEGVSPDSGRDILILKERGESAVTERLETGRKVPDVISLTEVRPAGLDISSDEELHQPQPGPLHHLHLVLRLEAEEGRPADAARQLGVAGEAWLCLGKYFNFLEKIFCHEGNK